MSGRLSYAVVTPAHNEGVHLPRLAECMRAQTVIPTEWIIVDNGSTDDTAQVAAEITSALPWARSIFMPKDDEAPRGAPVVRAFHAGLDALAENAQVVTKLDADVTFETDFFARIMDAFASDANLGITGGVCLEQDADGVWSPSTSPASMSAVRPVPIARRASPTCCRWKSVWAGTASTSSRSRRRMGDR